LKQKCRTVAFRAFGDLLPRATEQSRLRSSSVGSRGDSSSPRQRSKVSSWSLVTALVVLHGWVRLEWQTKGETVGVEKQPEGASFAPQVPGKQTGEVVSEVPAI